MAFPVNPYCWSKSAEHDVTLTTLTTDSKWHPSWVFFSMCRIVAGSGTANFKTKFPVLHELFAKNHRGSLDPSGARVNGYEVISNLSIKIFFIFAMSWKNLVKLYIIGTCMTHCIRQKLKNASGHFLKSWPRDISLTPWPFKVPLL